MTAAAPPHPGTEAGSGPFSIVVVASLLAIGIAAFSAFLLLGAFAPDLRGDMRGGNSALSQSAVGFAGLVALLRARDVPVAISRNADSVNRPEFLVLTPPADGKPIPWAMLQRATKATLIVMPKWRTTEDDTHPGWVRQAGLLDPHQVAATLPVPADVYRTGASGSETLHGGSGRMADIEALPLGKIDTLQKIDTGAGWTPLLLNQAGQAVLVRRTKPGQTLYVLSDPDLVNTQGLKDRATARAAMMIVDGLRDDAPVTFDVTLNGFGHAPNLLRLLFEPPLLGMTLCATACALLILAMALHRFGPPAPVARVLDFGKRALADNSAGLIARAGREPRMAVPYAQLIRALALRDLGIPARLEQRQMDEFLDTAARSHGLSDTYTALATAAGAVRDRAGLTTLAKRLHFWAEGFRRGHR